MSNSTFTLYEREITTIMEGDREEDHGWDRDPMELGDFATLREADYCKWLDYEDCDEGYGTLADYLED